MELRHRSWSDAIGETLSLLNAFGAAWVQIDEPKFRFSIRQNYLPNVTGFYYMRLHGRNAAQWWRHDKSEDRYNYLYTADELREFSETAGAAKELVKKSYLYTNNHFSSKSVVNARDVEGAARTTDRRRVSRSARGEVSGDHVDHCGPAARLRASADSRSLGDRGSGAAPDPTTTIPVSKLL